MAEDREGEIGTEENLNIRAITQIGYIMSFRTTLLLGGLLLAVAPALLAQEQREDRGDRAVRAGLGAWGTMNLHRGDFTSYDGVLECGTFDEATTIGWSVGYLFDFPLSSALSISPRFHYWKADGDFTTPNGVPTRIAVDDETVVPLETEHTLETALDYISLDLLVKLKVAGPLYLAAGPSIGYAARASYEQEERIVAPQGVTFLNGSDARNIIAGNFDEQGTLNTSRNLRLAAVGALGADIDLSDRLILSPEAGINWGLTDVLSSFPWKVHGLRAGALLSYRLGGTPPSDTVRIPPPDVATPEPVLALEAFNRSGGVQLNYAEIAIAEERGSDLIPLLPYIFFEPNSAAIPTRYDLSGDRNLTEADLAGTTLEVYHRLLDIVGSRMMRFPDATLTITGCREPLDDTGSTDALSRARADALREYLTGRWGIAPGRITTTIRALPTEPSNRTVDDGRQENRRAEITAGDPRILAPVNRSIGGVTLRPEQVVIAPTTQFLDDIASWNVVVRDGDGAELFRTDGNGAVPSEIAWRIDPDGADRMAGRGADEGSVSIELVAVRADGETIRRTRDVPVRRTFTSRRLSGEIVRDSLVERTSLIFFDFDSPKVSDFNRPVLDVVRARMRTSSAVEITGLTDRIGEEAHNEQLSRRRAEETARQIRTRIVPEVINARGAGEEEIYDNDLPEGRMYNRTVIVETATPIEEGVTW